jgi:hypothetical protein
VGTPFTIDRFYRLARTVTLWAVVSHRVSAKLWPESSDYPEKNSGVGPAALGG